MHTYMHAYMHTWVGIHACTQLNGHYERRAESFNPAAGYTKKGMTLQYAFTALCAFMECPLPYGRRPKRRTSVLPGNRTKAPPGNYLGLPIQLAWYFLIHNSL